MGLAQTTTTITEGTAWDAAAVLVAFIAGIGAVMIAGLALRETRQATKWAEIAAKAQQEGNRLIEASLRVDFAVILDLDRSILGNKPLSSWLELTCLSTSAPVWLQAVEATMVMFWYEGDNTPDIQDPMTLETDEELPYRLQPGGTVILADPYFSAHQGLATANSVFAVDVVYSIAMGGPP